MLQNARKRAERNPCRGGVVLRAPLVCPPPGRTGHHNKKASANSQFIRIHRSFLRISRTPGASGSAPAADHGCLRQHRTIHLQLCISSRNQIKDLDAHLSISAKKCRHQNLTFLRIRSRRIMRYYLYFSLGGKECFTACFLAYMALSASSKTLRKEK